MSYEEIPTSKVGAAATVASVASLAMLSHNLETPPEAQASVIDQVKTAEVSLETKLQPLAAMATRVCIPNNFIKSEAVCSPANFALGANTVQSSATAEFAVTTTSYHPKQHKIHGGKRPKHHKPSRYSIARLPRPLRYIGGCESSYVHSPMGKLEYKRENTTGSGASGAFQIMDGTWNGFGGYHRAKYAPKKTQNHKAMLLYRQQGTGPWLASKGCWGGAVARFASNSNSTR